MRRRPNTQTVQWFLELSASGQLDLEPSYQRRSVWNDEYRRYYIDTVLRDYPSPAIYLQVENRPGVPTLYHVIDGKQRLETLIGFNNGEFHLADRFRGEGLQQPYFDDLPQRLQEAFIDYILSVENITRAEPAELTQAFDRLNRNTAKLNRQELRKAQFEGRFISKMTELGADPYWQTLGMASRARVSRMLDVEFVSELYLLTMAGIQDGNDDLIDDYYAIYDDSIPDEEETDARYHSVLKWLEGLPLDLRGTRWRNLGDFYSLWAAVLGLLSELPDPHDAAERLTAFESSLSDPKTPEQREYADAVRQGTNKETSRQARTAVLKKVLIGEL